MQEAAQAKLAEQKAAQDSARKSAEDAERLKQEMLGDKIETVINVVGYAFKTRESKESLMNVQSYINRKTGDLTIEFDITPIVQYPGLPLCGQLLVRLFEKNGNYLNHFISKQFFAWKEFKEPKLPENLSGAKALKRTGNIIVTPISMRDAAFIQVIEVGWNF